jgi:hypothetical protein
VPRRRTATFHSHAIPGLALCRHPYISLFRITQHTEDSKQIKSNACSNNYRTFLNNFHPGSRVAIELHVSYRWLKPANVFIPGSKTTTSLKQMPVSGSCPPKMYKRSCTLVIVAPLRAEQPPHNIASVKCLPKFSTKNYNAESCREVATGVGWRCPSGLGGTRRKR